MKVFVVLILVLFILIIGTWISTGVIIWDKELNIGVVTRLDMHPVVIIFFAIWIVVFVLASTRFYNWYKSLVQKENTYKDFFNNAPMGIYQTSPQGEVLDVNQTLLDMMQYDSLSDLHDFNLEIEGYNEKSSEIRRRFKDIIERDGVVKGFEAEWKTREGEILHVRENARVVRDENDNILYYEGTVEDISKQKKAEENLYLSREQYKRLFENAPLGIYQTTRDGEIANANPALLRMLEYESLADIQNRDLEFEGYSKDSTIDRRQFVEMIERDGYVKGLEENWITKTGRVIPIRENARIVKGPDGGVSFYEGTVEDITERKKVEEENIKLSTAVEQSSNVIVITDVNGNIEYANPKFTEQTGYTAQEAFGQNPRILKTGTQTREYYAEMWQAITAGQTWRGQFNNKKKNGDCYWENVTITPIKNELGRITNFLAIKEDITAQKQSEEEIKRQNKALIIAKEKAEESDRLKSAFLANVSHEIRTPMNGIIGFTEMLKDPDLEQEEKDEFLGIIQESGKHLLDIINDLLEISRIESGQMELSIAEMNINELFEFIYSSFKPESDDKGIDLSINNLVDEKECIIETDYNKLCAIMNNLMKNAIKYSNEGSIEMGCKKNHKCFDFFVKDTGIGIHPDNKEVIFERFRQVSESSTREYDGAGLGLSIVKSYVELLGGRIWVESELRKGSVFYFTIPYN